MQAPHRPPIGRPEAAARSANGPSRRAGAFALRGVSILLALGACPIPALSQMVIGEIDRIRSSGLYEFAFELTDAATVEVWAVGAGPVDDEPLLAYAWILDASSRTPIWQMTRDNTKGIGRKDEDRIFEGEIELAEGRYIAYFSALQRNYLQPKRLKLFDRWIGQLRASSGFLAKWDEFGDPRRWGLRLEVSRDRRDVVRDWNGEIDDDAFLHFAPLGDSAHEFAAFRVKRRVDATIRCLAEYDRGSESYVDRSWLADALTRHIVWQTNEDDAIPAGGGLKNHAFDVELELEPGDYVLTSVTDDSHSFEEWNETPPYDPQGWGISFDADDTDALELIKDPKEDLLIAKIERARDSTYERRAFRLSRPVTVLVEGQGELDHDHLVDYGWIERLPEGNVVWSMERERGEHAGGTFRNRYVSATLDLDAGTYVLAYLTDESHAYDDWRDPGPSDPTRWGVAMYATSRDFDPSWVTPVDPREADASVISLAPTGDHTHRKQLMTLPRTYDLRVVCLGEGLDGRMYDYGYIEDAETNRIVWEMEFDRAEPAGGASKNLMVDEEISLAPGRYLVHYVTDGSHSFEEWNATPPDRPQLWGITIYPKGSGPELARRWD